MGEGIRGLSLRLNDSLVAKRGRLGGLVSISSEGVCTMFALWGVLEANTRHVAVLFCSVLFYDVGQMDV